MNFQSFASRTDGFARFCSILAIAVYAGLLAAPATAAAHSAGRWGIEPTDVVPDPSIRYGTLPNGMKYAIRVNTTPKGAASVRLHFDFGSLAESEDERGLAHFIEHMAFNGSTNVPEGEMRKILERQGLAFGPDTNASTSFDSTVYMLELPKADEQRLDTALFLLREVASEIRFDPKAVDRERGVLISERRSRDSFQLRRLIENLEFHVPLTPHSKRLPIGTDEVLGKASAETLRDLYRRYYRPENATLVIVGDFYADSVESKIRAKFADWSGKGAAGQDPQRGRVDLGRPAAVESFADPAVETSVMLSVMRPWEDPADSRAERRRSTIRGIGLNLLTRRLQLLANAPDSKLISAAAAHAPNKEIGWTSTVSAVAPDGEWRSALATIEQELRRALQHGFTASELRVEIASVEGGLKAAAERASTRSSSGLAQSILAVIDEDDFITTPQYRYDFFREMARGLTVAEVNSEFRQIWTGSPPLVFVTDKKPIADETEIAAVLEDSRKVAVPPQQDRGPLKFAYEDFGTPGAVVADSRVGDLGIRTVRFANNVRLSIKKTDFEKGSVRYSVRLAGGDLALPRDRPGLQQMITMLSALGSLEKHSEEDLRQILAGRMVRPGIAVASDAIVAAGRTTPEDLLLQMKLSTAFITAPGYRAEAANRWKSLVPVIDAQSKATPQAVARAKLGSVIANDDPRFGYPDADILIARRLEEAKTALDPILASAPIEIGIVGDVDETTAIDAVARTFGALPARRPEPPAYLDSRKASFRADLRPVTLTHSGQADQAIIVAAWATDDDDDQDRVIGLNLLSDVLRLQLTERLREELGETYGASVASVNSDVYDGFGYLSVSSVVAPGKMDLVEQAVAEVVAAMLEKPVGEDLFARALNPNLERIDRQLRENDYWLALVDQAQTDPDRLDRHRRRKGAYLAVTSTDLQRLAQQYLAPGKTLRVRIVPEPEKLAAR